MTFNEYRQKILQTWVVKTESVSFQLANAALGLAEIGELRTARGEDFVDELGDFTYYVVMIYNILEYDIDFGVILMNTHSEDFVSVPLTKNGITFDIIAERIFNIQNLAKKMLFHGKPLDETIRSIIKANNDILLNYIIAVCEFSTLSVSEVFQYNIDKLHKRHNIIGNESNFVRNSN